MPPRQTKSDLAQLNLQLERSLLLDVKALAIDRGVSLSAFVRSLLQEAVDLDRTGGQQTNKKAKAGKVE